MFKNNSLNSEIVCIILMNVVPVGWYDFLNVWGAENYVISVEYIIEILDIRCRIIFCLHGLIQVKCELRHMSTRVVLSPL